MRSLVVVAALAGPVHAEAMVETEIGAGANTIDDEVTASGYARLAAHASRWVPPERRGLHICDVDGKPGCLWVYTGIDHDAREGVGVEAKAELLAGQPRLEGHAWAAVAGWGVGGRWSYQQPTELIAHFARSNREVLEQKLELDIPPMWAIGVPAVQLSVGRIDLDLGWRAQLVGERWRKIGFDFDLALRTARIHFQRGFVDLFRIRLWILGFPEASDGMTTTGTEVSALDFDLAALDVRLAGDTAVVLRGGFSGLEPIARYESTGNSTHSEGPLVVRPAYWAGVRHGQLDAHAPGFAVELGAGSWMRIDPTGHAIDAGEVATARAELRRKQFSIEGGLQLGRLRRAGIGYYAPEGLAPVGTRFAMGRGSLGATLHLTRTVWLAGSGWVERSDRDDPRWTATPGVQTHAGADLHAVWALARKP